MKKVWILFFFLLGLLPSCKQAVLNDNGWMILDMVHHNPAEALTETSFTNPEKLSAYGYTGRVINDFTFVHAAISYDSFDPEIFPAGSEEYKWVQEAAENLDLKIRQCHDAGIKAYCFTDIIVLPKQLVEKYKSELCNEEGIITFQKPLTEEIHRILIREIFQRFPELDGLVIRTGETYLHNVPHHTGNNPIINGPESHKKLLEILREEACEKLGKEIIYRTWDFGMFHVKPEYYLAVTEQIEPHNKLFFSIKHTEGDYHRTFPFNPTLGIGRHKQIVEVQCQREYEGKGAHPDYVIPGVLNGFEEYGETLPRGLNDLKKNENFAGIWSWSRGGGWVGPYITNELWCDLNAYVISQWAQDPELSEEQIFMKYTDLLGLSLEDASSFRKICLLSADGVLRGHNSLVHPVNVWWTRDQFLGGLDLLEEDFRSIIHKGQVDAVLSEKDSCVQIWKEINHLASTISSGDQDFQSYLKVSTEYALLKYSIISEGWRIMLKGLEGDMMASYDITAIGDGIQAYDSLWKEYRMLKENHPDCATLYKPYSFYFEYPDYHRTAGMDSSVHIYRQVVKTARSSVSML